MTKDFQKPAPFAFSLTLLVNLSPCLLAPLAPASCLCSHGYTIVVEVPSFSEGKSIQVWKDALATIDGVKLQEYCSAQGWLVLEVDDSIIPSSSDPEMILRNGNLQGIIKYGATGAQVEANCKGEMKYLNKRSYQ